MKIFLLGLMGSGKSFWADKLSAVLNIHSYHLDDEIEKAEGKAVREIFIDDGEEYFRKKENEVLKRFAGEENFVVSTGGGTPCFFDNIKWMNKQGITIWLDESIEIIAARLQKEKSHRPLLDNVADDNLQFFLSEMREKRKPFYAKARHIITGADINETNFIKLILSNE